MVLTKLTFFAAIIPKLLRGRDALKEKPSKTQFDRLSVEDLIHRRSDLWLTLQQCLLFLKAPTLITEYPFNKLVKDKRWMQCLADISIKWEIEKVNSSRCGFS